MLTNATGRTAQLQWELIYIYVFGFVFSRYLNAFGMDCSVAIRIFAFKSLRKGSKILFRKNREGPGS